MKSIKALLALSAALLSATVSSATTLTSYISMDNGFIAYLSTSNSTTGTVFSSANDWYHTYSGTTAPLASGTDYYLHIFGYDQGGIAGFLGRFELNGSTHVFANGSTTLLTNTTDWTANNVGFNGTYSSVISLGNNDVGPWGTRPYIPSGVNGATWIWAGDAHGNDYAYFTTKISAVATPDAASSAAMIFFGLASIAAFRRSRGRA